MNYSTLCLFPGSFSILHMGHLSIAHFVEEKYDCEIIFEICREPYDKPPLDDKEIDKRAKQFRSINKNCLITDNTSFVEKSTDDYNSLFEEEFDEKYFIVGFDSLKRIDDIKYYFQSNKEKEICLNTIKDFGWKFLVFPRNNELTSGISDQLSELCIFQGDFKQIDISSTSIREKKTQLLGLTIYGSCFILNGNKYKLVNTRLEDNIQFNYCKVFNGQEFIQMNFDNVMVELSDVDFYPYMDDFGRNK